MNKEKEIERINKIIENNGRYVRSFGKKVWKPLTRKMKTVLQIRALALFAQEEKLLWTGKMHPRGNHAPVAFMGTYVKSFHGELKEEGRYGQPRYT